MAGKNDVKLAERTKVGRNINRHYYTKEEIDCEVRRPFLQKLYRLMKFRNSHSAFNGQVEIGNDDIPGRLLITWRNKKQHSRALR